MAYFRCGADGEKGKIESFTVSGASSGTIGTNFTVGNLYMGQSFSSSGVNPATAMQGINIVKSFGPVISSSFVSYIILFKATATTVTKNVVDFSFTVSDIMISGVD